MVKKEGGEREGEKKREREIERKRRKECEKGTEQGEIIHSEKNKHMK